MFLRRVGVSDNYRKCVCVGSRWHILAIFVSELLQITPHTPSSEPVKCDKQDGTWYTHNGVDIQDTLQRKGLSLFIQVIFKISVPLGRNGRSKR